MQDRRRNGLAGLVVSSAMVTAIVFGLSMSVAWALECKPVPEQLAGKARVSDGDTISIGGVRVRLFGIDAPELGQTCEAEDGATWPCGIQAARELAALADGHETTCARSPKARDQYCRMLAICSTTGTDLGAHLTRRGLAWVFMEHPAQYRDLETTAKSEKRGIWQVPSTQTAKQYRDTRWKEAMAKAPEGRPIKGNISKRGECIYHLPWSPSYPDIRMDKGRGERWFADENEAIDAGCRPPRWRFKRRT